MQGFYLLALVFLCSFFGFYMGYAQGHEDAMNKVRRRKQ